MLMVLAIIPGRLEPRAGVLGYETPLPSSELSATRNGHRYSIGRVSDLADKLIRRRDLAAASPEDRFGLADLVDSIVIPPMSQNRVSASFYLD